MGLRAETRPQGWIALFLVDVGLSDIHEAPCLERGFPGSGLTVFGLEVDAHFVAGGPGFRRIVSYPAGIPKVQSAFKRPEYTVIVPFSLSIFGKL